MSEPAVTESAGKEGVGSDAEMQKRTRDLLEAAERISLQLAVQTERLAAAIDMFDRDIIRPLREGLNEK